MSTSTAGKAGIRQFLDIGLTARMMGGKSRDLTNGDRRVRALLRRLDVVNETLDRAQEVEDFQAAGMRLRELLITLTFSLSELIQTSGPTAELRKAANFKALADIYARCSRVSADVEQPICLSLV